MYGDIIILAVIASFIIFKLYNVLGQYNDDDKNSRKSTKNDKQTIIDIFPLEEYESDIDIELPEERKYGEAIEKGLNAIKEIDPSFNSTQFLNGATTAFEMILKAYSEHDKKTLKSLLSKNVYNPFSKDIDQRVKNNTHLDKTLVSLVSADIVSAAIEKHNIIIDVRFVSQQINLIRDIDKNILEGNPSEIDSVNDIWTFTRDANSNNPNWYLAETKES